MHKVLKIFLSFIVLTIGFILINKDNIDNEINNLKWNGENANGFFTKYIPKKLIVGYSQFGPVGMFEIVTHAILDRFRGYNRITPTRSAWINDLIQTLTDFDKKYILTNQGVVTDDDIAEAHYFGLNLLHVGLDAFVFNADPVRPRFRNLFNPDKKWLVDNPDVYYFTSPVLDQNMVYRVTGKRSSEVYISITVYTHKFVGSFSESIVSEAAYPNSLTGNKLKLDSNGVWKARLSAIEPNDLEENEVWIKLPNTTALLLDAGEQASLSCLTRHYFEEEDVPSQLKSKNVELDIVALKNDYLDNILKQQNEKQAKGKGDWNADVNRQPMYSNEWKAGGVAGPPQKINAADITNRIKWLSNFIRNHSIDRIAAQADLNAVPKWYSLYANQIGRPDYFVSTISNTKGIGAPDVTYSAGPWRLEDDEVLIIEAIMPPCLFGNVLMMNRHLQTIGYQYGRYQSYNRLQLARLDSKVSKFRDDGTLPYRIVVSHRDPGPGFNWLDTGKFILVSAT